MAMTKHLVEVSGMSVDELLIKVASKHHLSVDTINALTDIYVSRQSALSKRGFLAQSAEGRSDELDNFIRRVKEAFSRK